MVLEVTLINNRKNVRLHTDASVNLAEDEDHQYSEENYVTGIF